MKQRKRLGEILVDMGLLTNEQVEAALKIQKRDGGLLGTVLIQNQFVKEADITIALAKQGTIPYLPIQNYEINKSVLSSIPAEFAIRNNVIPIDKIHHHLVIVMADPTNQYVVEDILEMTKCKLTIFIGIETEIKKEIMKYYKIDDERQSA